MKFGDLYTLGSGVSIKFAGAARTWSDPNSTNKEKFDAALSVIGLTQRINNCQMI
jgi:hypothetical protein